MLFAAFKVALAWFVIGTALRLCAGPGGDFPPWAALVVVLLSLRVLLSDVAHGNINLILAAAVALAAAQWTRGNAFRAGVSIGFAAVLKVTPAIFVLFFLRKKSLRGLEASPSVRSSSDSRSPRPSSGSTARSSTRVAGGTRWSLRRSSAPSWARCRRSTSTSRSSASVRAG